MRNLVIIVIAVVFFSPLINAQSNRDNFAIGFSISSTFFEEIAIDKLGERYNSQFPRINFTGELTDKFSFDLALTFNVVGSIKGLVNNEFEYTALDASIRYYLFRTDAVIVPYVGFGVSHIGGASSAVNAKDVFSFNLLAGGTIWILPKFGFITQLTYKYVSPDEVSMVSHFQSSVGIAYRFGSGSSSRKRIWDK